MHTWSVWRDLVEQQSMWKSNSECHALLLDEALQAFRRQSRSLMSQQTRHRRLCTMQVLNMLSVLLSCRFIMVS